MQNYDRVKSDPVSAELYTRRRPSKHQFEMQMVAEAIGMLPANSVKTVLDAPCGVGRLSLWLGQKGFTVSAVDLGESAVKLTRELLAKRGVEADVMCDNLFKLQFETGRFDASICFRLLHHFGKSSDQQALVAELCRVSSKYVIISYFSPYSITTLRRKLRRFLYGAPIKQNPNSLSEVQRLFEPHGFKLLGTVKRSGLLHSLQVAVFEKRASKS